MKTIKKDDFNYLTCTDWCYTLETSSKSIKENTKYDGLTFDNKSKDRFIRNVLCELKGHLDSIQTDFNVRFERWSGNGDNLGYDFTISPKESTDIRNRNIINEYRKMIAYCISVLEYMFSDKIDVSSISYRNSIAFTIIIRTNS